MKHIAYIIGHRTTDPFRIRNLLLTTKWLIKLKKILFYEGIQLSIVVVEQDSKPTINNLLSDYVNYIFSYNSGQYNRGWAFNVGFIKFRNADYFYFADNDIILNNEEMINVFKTCFLYSAVNPYSQVFDTKSKLFESHITIPTDLNYIIKNNFINGKREHTCFTGGIVGLSKKAMQIIGGWDERFRGRGWEDYALTSTVKLFLPDLYTYKYNALHFWHPLDINADREKTNV